MALTTAAICLVHQSGLVSGLVWYISLVWYHQSVVIIISQSSVIIWYHQSGLYPVSDWIMLTGLELMRIWEWGKRFADQVGTNCTASF
mmetsp:Transcript_39037/g.47259  ORF Transcript_39037/g.47259 Transcript_39037/m.47259 type:complete len:88 (+) Transcript_39037:131-394(+)